MARTALSPRSRSVESGVATFTLRASLLCLAAFSVIALCSNLASSLGQDKELGDGGLVLLGGQLTPATVVTEAEAAAALANEQGIVRTLQGAEASTAGLQQGLPASGLVPVLLHNLGLDSVTDATHGTGNSGGSGSITSGGHESAEVPQAMFGPTTIEGLRAVDHYGEKDLLQLFAGGVSRAHNLGAQLGKPGDEASRLFVGHTQGQQQGAGSIVAPLFSSAGKAGTQNHAAAHPQQQQQATPGQQHLLSWRWQPERWVPSQTTGFEVAHHSLHQPTAAGTAAGGNVGEPSRSVSAKALFAGTVHDPAASALFKRSSRRLMRGNVP